MKDGITTNSANIKYFTKEFQLKRHHKTDAGYDIHADTSSPVTINSGQFKTIDTEVIIQLPNDVEAQIRPRSGLASKLGITVLNSPGTIDPGYRGKIKVVLINHGPEPYTFNRGDAIAQVVFQKLSNIESIKVNTEKDLNYDTIRKDSGFGSTDAKQKGS